MSVESINTAFHKEFIKKELPIRKLIKTVLLNVLDINRYDTAISKPFNKKLQVSLML